jgi:uncharacterized membrane protein HdeD (DUF308 family)
MLHAISRKWWVPLIRGICAILFGLFAITSPVISLFVLALLYGAVVFADGVTGIVLGIRGGMNGRSWWEMILLGLLGVFAGLVAIAWPGLTIVILVFIIAWWAIIRGIFEIVAAIRLRRVIQGEWLLILSGIITVLFGLVLLFRPIAGALTLMLFVGWFMIFLGILAIGFSFRLRGLKKRLSAATA